MINELIGQSWLERRLVNVITGPTLDTYESVYYVVSSCSAPYADNMAVCPVEERQVQAFLLPRRSLLSAGTCGGGGGGDRRTEIARNVASLRDVERLTGLVFFPNLAARDKLQLLARTPLESRLVLDPANRGADPPVDNAKPK